MLKWFKKYKMLKRLGVHSAFRVSFDNKFIHF